MKTISDLESDLKEEILSNFGELVNETKNCLHDQLTEYASGWVPGSDKDLAEIFVSNRELGNRSEYTSENMDVFDILRANLDASLQDTAQGYYEELERDYEALKEDFESEGLEVVYHPEPKRYMIAVIQDDNEANMKPFNSELFKSEYDAIKWWEKQGETTDGTSNNAG